MPSPTREEKVSANRRRIAANRLETVKVRLERIKRKLTEFVLVNPDQKASAVIASLDTVIQVSAASKPQ